MKSGILLLILLFVMTVLTVCSLKSEERRKRNVGGIVLRLAQVIGLNGKELWRHVYLENYRYPALDLYLKLVCRFKFSSI